MPSLIGRVRKLEAQLKIAQRALWHYSKYLGWYSCRENCTRCHFDLGENQQGGRVVEGDEIAREAVRQIYELESKKHTPMTDYKVSEETRKLDLEKF